MSVETVIDATKQGITFEEFLALFGEDDRVEWVNGEVERMSPVADRHQQITQFLIKLVGLYLEVNPIGELLQEYTVKLGTSFSARVPDLLFLAAENLDRNRHTYIDGAVDIAFEVVSLDSRARDRGEKFYEYEQAGIREYWLIDPLRSEAEFYILGEDGKYHTASLSSMGHFESTVLEGLKINPKWFWLYPLPNVTSILKEAGVKLPD